jgi:hypothetical protein
MGLRAVMSGPITVNRRLDAIHSGSCPPGGGGGAVVRRTPEMLIRTGHYLGACEQAIDTAPRDVARVELRVTHPRGLIARRGFPIPLSGAHVTGRGRLDPGVRRFSPLFGATVTQLTRRDVHPDVPPVNEVAITSNLILIRRRLIAVGRRLVAVRTRLIAVGQSLVTVRVGLIIGRRLIVLMRFGWTVDVVEHAVSRS